jgi:hypothetical protein
VKSVNEQEPQPPDRQDVIDRSINVENLLAVLITHRFFPGPVINGKFLQIVLYDQHANTAFKVSVYEKCYSDTHNNVLQALRRLFAIRNLFAHCGLHMTSLVDPDSSGIMDPKKLDTPLNFSALRTEFLEKEQVCLKHLVARLDSSKIMESHA